MQYYSKYPILCLSVLLTTCHALDNIPILSAQSSRAALSPQISEAQQTTPLKPQRKWSRYMGRGNSKHFPKFNIITHNQQLFAIKRSGKILSLNPLDGRTYWQANTRHPITAPPAINKELLFLVTSEPKLLALHTATGKLAWSIPLDSLALAKPALKEGRIIIKTQTGKVVAFDIQKGKKLWQYQHFINAPMALHVSSAPQITEDQVLVGFPEGELISLNLQSGLRNWGKALAEPSGSSAIAQLVDIATDPIVDQHGTIYASTYQANLTALSIYSGAIRWQQSFSGSSGLALNRYLYSADENGCVWAFEPKIGKIIWQKTLANYRLTAPTIYPTHTDTANSIILLGDNQGNFYGLSSENGQLLLQGKSKHPAPMLTPPIVQEGTVYTVTERGEITAWGIPNR